jgi:hypothetical protein
VRSRIALGAASFVVLAVVLARAAPSAAGSVSATTFTLRGVVGRSARIVRGKILSTAPAQIDGATLSSLQVAVDKTLKGSPGAPGEIVRLFDPGQWFAHTHAAAIRAGVISYEDPRYATRVTPAELKKGAVLIFYLGGEAAPSGFPPGAAFLTCGQAYDRADRERDIGALKAP